MTYTHTTAKHLRTQHADRADRGTQKRKAETCCNSVRHHFTHVCVTAYKNTMNVNQAAQFTSHCETGACRRLRGTKKTIDHFHYSDKENNVMNSLTVTQFNSIKDHNSSCSLSYCPRSRFRRRLHVSVI